MSGVPTEHAQTLFAFEITSVDSLHLLTREILEKMDIVDPEVQEVILKAANMAAQGNILTP